MNKRKRKSSESQRAEQLDCDSRQKADQLFEKKFCYVKCQNEEWTLPDLDKIEENQSKDWIISDLEVIKTDLNTLKDKLSDKDVISWNEHTCYMNYAAGIMSEIRRRFHPELCTQAWCKFYEIAAAYNVVNLVSDEIYSVHLCEAPGAFITSLNHYLVANGYSGDWRWTGTTLNPYYEGNSISYMIEDDKFLRDTYADWYFGVNNTGDLLNIENLHGLLDVASKIGPVHLVTADGSFDCQNNPAEQEVVVSPLHYCETLTALLLLTPGGSFVMKMFTMFETKTLCLVYLLNCMFEQVHVFKPATSKSGNSEVYFVCLGFLGLQDREQFISFSNNIYGAATGSDAIYMFNQADIPESFIDQHIQCCKFFTEIQKDTITTNLENYPLLPEDYRVWLDSVKDYCAYTYIKRYHVRNIPKQYRIVSPSWWQRKGKQREYISRTTFPLKRRHSGTFTERQKLKSLCWKDRLKHIPVYDVGNDDVVWLERLTAFSYTEEDTVKSWKCARGKPVSYIHSSKFCDGKLITLLQEILVYASVESHCKKLKDELIQNFKHSVNNVTNDVTTDTELVIYVVDVLDQVCDLQHAKISPVHKVVVTSLSEVSESEFNTDLQHIFYMNLVDKGASLEQEIEMQKIFVQSVVQILKKLPNSSKLIIHMSTCLTRFTAGVVYILSQAFELVGFSSHQGNTLLQQSLICTNFYGIPVYLQEHLQQVAELMTDSKINLLESVPVIDILMDYDFASFLRRTNETLLKSCINTIIKSERQKYNVEISTELA